MRALTRRQVAAAVLLILLASAAPGVSAAPLSAGQDIAPMATVDQHDKPWRLEARHRWLLFAADKAASDLAVDVLRPHGADVLTTLDAAFLADIHAMPALITRLFALPALRALSFPIGLAREAPLAAELPRVPKQMTLLRLRDGVVQSVQHIPEAATLRQALALPAP